MRLISLELESKWRANRLWSQSWVGWAALYVLGLDVLLFAAQWMVSGKSPATAASLIGWVIFLSLLAMVLLAISAYRWIRARLLWRLRNRLIVTYVFIGVIPVFLLVAISLGTLYLLAGQFASFVVTSDIATHLRSMAAANRTIAHHLATQMANGGKLDLESVGQVRSRRPEWAQRQVCAWRGNQVEPLCSGPQGVANVSAPSFLTGDFGDIAIDGGKLYLRTANADEAEHLLVILSEPFDRNFVEKFAGDLGRIAVYGTGTGTGTAGSSSSSAAGSSAPARNDGKAFLPFDNGARQQQMFTAGTIPAASNALDHTINLKIPLEVVDWSTGARRSVGAIAEVDTRTSMLYATLFGARGDYAKGLETILALVAITFAMVVGLALVVGTKLTRSITSAVGQLYEATTHINRADFSHRITVQSTDQLATLANSFNSMTTSIETLIQEQKEKQRLEGELAIAQEVQAQLYPKLITQLDTLEVHGFCRPARTVSGDYYDFVALNSDRMMLAVGDISGKGISAALLMATIYSAVRAYSIEDVPVLREASVSAGLERTAGDSGLMLASESRGADASPAKLLPL